MKRLDLFDNIPYKYFKELYSFYDIDVNIKEIETDDDSFKTSFKFNLDIHNDNNLLKEFNVILEYTQKSIIYPYIVMILKRKEVWLNEVKEAQEEEANIMLRDEYVE